MRHKKRPIYIFQNKFMENNYLNVNSREPKLYHVKFKKPNYILKNPGNIGFLNLDLTRIAQCSRYNKAQ